MNWPLAVIGLAVIFTGGCMYALLVLSRTDDEE